MLNNTWVMLGGVLERGTRLSASDLVALPFEGFSRSRSVHRKGRRFIKGVTTKNNQKEKTLC
jgi:hypothetical protein